MNHDLAEEFRAKKRAGHQIAALTAYDYPLGRLLDGMGLDFLLVGDSLGMVILGHPDTTQVCLRDMVHHTSAVANGVKNTPLVADLPAHSIGSVDDTLAGAAQLIDAGAQAVKLEGGEEVLPLVEALLGRRIPVLGHIGMLPQRVREEGGYRVKGKTPQQAGQLERDALALDRAGVIGIVMELVSPPLAEAISAQVACPTVGIGSGTGCDGQILVTHDLLGLFPWFTPRFVKPKLNLATQIEGAVAEYIRETREKWKD